MNWIQTKFLALLLKMVQWLFTQRYGKIPAKSDIEGWRIYLQNIVNGNDIAMLVLLTKTKLDDYGLMALKFACSTPALFQTTWVWAFNQKTETQKNEPEPKKFGLIRRIINRFTTLPTFAGRLSESGMAGDYFAGENRRLALSERTGESALVGH
ncbi:hypothetical protein FACS189454_10150 [Planctomycetales bacterium]|nr:hypothetical protein FACS189454_10150 [Planctomycetales bacterium]